jgi:hypothetical protein
MRQTGERERKKRTQIIEFKITYIVFGKNSIQFLGLLWGVRKAMIQ